MLLGSSWMKMNRLRYFTLLFSGCLNHFVEKCWNWIGKEWDEIRSRFDDFIYRLKNISIHFAKSNGQRVGKHKSMQQPQHLDGFNNSCKSLFAVPIPQLNLPTGSTAGPNSSTCHYFVHPNDYHFSCSHHPLFGNCHRQLSGHLWSLFSQCHRFRPQ